MLEKEVIFGIITGSLVVAFLLILLLFFLLYYFKNKNRFLREKEEMKNKFQLEIAHSAKEIQEETIKQLGYELHDNIGQLVTIAKIQAQSLKKQVDHPKLPELVEAISKALDEVRRLSKSLDPEVLRKNPLRDILKKDADRIRQLGSIEFLFNESGEPYELEDQRKIILYRVLQEMTTNALKHAKCSTIILTMDYQPDRINIEWKDNGIGFDPEKLNSEQGIGLHHIGERIKLINGKMLLTSSPGNGTVYSIEISAN